VATPTLPLPFPPNAVGSRSGSGKVRHRAKDIVTFDKYISPRLIW